MWDFFKTMYEHVDISKGLMVKKKFTTLVINNCLTSNKSKRNMGFFKIMYEYVDISKGLMVKKKFTTLVINNCLTSNKNKRNVGFP
jgi:glutaredoxin-related protein